MDENTLVEDFLDEELTGFRLCVAEKYRELDEETLEMMLDETLANMTPEEAEGFLSSLKKVGKAALPTVGAAVGTAIGGALGNVASQSLRGGGKKASSSPRKPVRNRRSSYRKIRKRNLPDSSLAIKQLLQLIQSPRFLQALTSLNLGEQGRKAIAIGRQESLSSVPTGAFLNLLESLANEAAMEAAQNESMIPSYLEAADGEALCDLASPDERAKVLMERLQEDDLYLETDLDEDEDDESDNEVFNWLEQAGLVEERFF